MRTVKEDKAKTTQKLFEALATTSEYEGLESLEYFVDDRGEEYVRGTFENGYSHDVCVTANSCIALIRQVSREL